MSESARAGPREWIALAVLALPCLLYSMDLTVLYLAVPKLSADLQPSGTELLWISDVYGFLLAGLLITMGTLGDRIGRRRLLLIGAAAFGAASVLAAFSTSAEMLIAARALLGVAGATLAPSTLSLLRALFDDPDQRTVAIGVWITSFSAGAAIGPLVGGAMLELFWWGSVFLVAVPVMALLLVLGPRLLPESRDPDAGALDLTSAILSLIAVLALVYGLKEIAQDGLGWWPVATIAAGTAGGAAFLARQRSLSYPLVDVRLFRIPAFSTSVAGMYAAVFVVAGIELFVAQYLQLVLGKSPLEAGLLTLPSAGGLIAGSLLAPLLARRIRAAPVLSGGLAVAAAGAAVLTQIEAGSAVAVIVAGMAVTGLGAGAVGTVATDLVVATAPAPRAGAASAISETSAELGGALGIAVLGSIGTAIYRSELATAMPADVPGAAAQSARETLGGATEAADTLPAPLSAQLLDAAHDAFSHGLELAALIAAATVLALALLAALVLKADNRRAEHAAVG
jgi:DHA2 family multidrug resistance protein-like MFS transporter